MTDLLVLRGPGAVGRGGAMLGADYRVVRRGPGFAGSIGAVVLFCLSLTPSLLPRHWALQGVVSGITMAIGYGAGATVGALARTLWPALAVIPRRAWTVLAGAAAAVGALFLLLGHLWQQDLRELVGTVPAAPWEPALVVVVAVAVFALLLAVARAVRLATRRLASTLGRFSPRPVASFAAVGLVAALSYGIGPGMAFPGFLDVAHRAAAHANGNTAAGVDRPASPYVSGGPGSLVPWDTLGAYGREFTATAVSHKDLAAFGDACEPKRDGCGGSEGTEPIRVYVGRDSAATMDERAALAVRELERTGAFGRSVLAVVTTTGTGWVNPVVPASLEYLYGGDSAVVAMQYSYLPSWISFMADRSTVTEAAATLIGAVRDRLADLPAGQRPALVVYGESLGAHGVESAFGDLDALRAETDGVLLAGPPHTNPIWRRLVDEHQPDTPMWRPVQDGVVYLQNASDPVVRWSPELLYREPEWLDGERGPDVSGAMRWFPVVTFWQVTVDLVTSTKAPTGHGHSYGESIADAWLALVPPSGWTGADTRRLYPLLVELSE